MYNQTEKNGKSQQSCNGENMFTDDLSLRGEIKVQVFDKHGVLVSEFEDKNFIVDKGHEIANNLLNGTFNGLVGRMGIGDQGTLSGQPYVPKTADATWPARTALFHDVIRKDLDSATPGLSLKNTRYLCSFTSASIAPASFTSSPYLINEASLWLIPRVAGIPAVYGVEQASTGFNANQYMFSMRTFKSQPFDPADTLTLTIAWTIYVQ